MTVASTAQGRSTGKLAISIILVVIAIVGIVAGAIYFMEPAKSLPSFLGAISSPAARANAHRTTRGEVALAVGVVCLLAAGFAGWMGRRSK